MRTRRLYGSDAVTWLAHKAADHCFTVEKAEELIRNSTGHYRDVLIARLQGTYLTDKNGKRRKFKLTKKLGKEMEETDARVAKLAEKRFNYERMFAMRDNKLRTAKGDSKKPCIGCGRTIKAGAEFYQTSHRWRTYKAHRGCADRARSPRA